MNKKFTFRHMEHSNTLEQYANQHLLDIERMLEGEREPIYLEIVFDAEHTHHHHRVEMILKSPHYDLFASDEGPEMYTVLLSMLDKMDRLLRDKKKALLDKRKDGVVKREIK